MNRAILTALGLFRFDDGSIGSAPTPEELHKITYLKELNRPRSTAEQEIIARAQAKHERKLERNRVLSTVKRG